MKLIESEVKLYFRTARERYRIMLKRNNDDRPPWSNDEIFNNWFFCNVFREDDKTTMWIKKLIREPHRNDPNVLWMMVACRVFNKISTLEKLWQAGIFHLTEWNRSQANAALEDVSPITGAAYCVCTPGGINKLNGCLKLIDNAAKDNDRLIKLIEPGTTTLEQVWSLLKAGECFGPFMAYEIVTDLRYTYLLENAPDIMTWANPGPGACRGISRLVGEKVSHGSEAVLVCMRGLLNQAQYHWPSHWPQWDMRTVEHWLCEHSKWCRVNFEGKHMKRKYNS